MNILNNLKKSQINKSTSIRGDTIHVNKRDIPLSKEWYNSLYVFNKNTIRFMPAVHDYVFRLIKSYFNSVSKNLEVVIKSRRLMKIKKFLNNKVWVSTPEIKHINEKLIITIYVYNRLYNQYKKELSLLEFKWGPQIKNNKHKKIIYNKTLKKEIIMSKKIKSLRHKLPIYLGTNKAIYHKTNTYYIKMIKWLKLDKYINMERYKVTITKLIKENKLELFKAIKNIKIERYNYLINQFKKELTFLKLRQKALFNQLKFKESYLILLINFLETIYNKKVELNIVMLKYHYLSSSILSQTLISRVINPKNRGKWTKPVNKAMEYICIPSLSSNKLPRIDRLPVGVQNVIYNEFITKKHDHLNEFLLINKNTSIWSSNYIDNLVLKNLENKSVAGIFVKLAGRLTKRFKAQRAVSNLKYIGTLKNVHSAHKGFSSALSKGYSNINVEKTMTHSKVRIGAFGITGWVASY